MSDIVDPATKRNEDRTEADWVTLMERYGIPEHCQEGLTAHIMTGRPVGHFLTAMLEGKLFEACSRADEENEHAIYRYARFLHHRAPIGCFGSAEAVEQWRELGGLAGIMAHGHGSVR
jgi:hypothetical protein